MTVDSLLEHWKRDPDTSPNLIAWRTLPPRPARTHPFPDDLPESLARTLIAAGIHSLYTHQVEAWTAARNRRNVILSTGTASGKTLAYNLPIFASLIRDERARALYLFPTKALAQDQLSNLQSLDLTLGTWNLAPAIYDGDTPQKDRSQIRKNARIILTNPDMLHTGILPHHTNWLEFFTHLTFVVIDEAHTYRGVFGSHVANVLRRLKRVARFYGAQPQYILASATIGNPRELAEKLIEEPVTLIENDGSARGPRHFILYNPPFVDKSLGLRKSSLLESVRLAQDALKHDLQSVVFARSRQSVEIILTYLQGNQSPVSNLQPPITNYNLPNAGSPIPQSFTIRGYRSGYLPHQRREIEKGLREGTVKTVVATNALELGIDIGGLEAAILVGYPGTVASARQQAGRAGRGLESAVSVMIASANPIDQFLAHHPEYFFERSPEQALINPDHLLILLEHLRCALFELPFQQGEGFGAVPAETIDEYLNFLVENREAHASNENFFWMADQYPAANISLRSASAQSVVLQTTMDDKPSTIGTVDGESAAWMTHPGAIYMHEARQFFVEQLDLDRRLAILKPLESDYYTEPLRSTTVEVLSISDEFPSPGGRGRPEGSGEGETIIATKAWGELLVTTQVTAFLKRRWYTHETLGQEPLELPPSELQTTGYWLSLSDETVARLREAGAWSNDPNDYGPEWKNIRDRVRARDKYTCQVCGTPETPPTSTGAGRQHDVHHKVPFRSFTSREEANRLENLVTLCHGCHKKVEENVRIRSGLAGLAYVLGNLAPLFLMCDSGDLGTHIEPVQNQTFGRPTVVIYDSIPAGIGFSQKLFEMHDDLISRASELVAECACEDGCPSCVGPGGENGGGGKHEALAILKEMTLRP
jgi:DEAD/DEAH box helicase domain-containing protein